jgi:hypothetical protein
MLGDGSAVSRVDAFGSVVTAYPAMGICFWYWEFFFAMMEEEWAGRVSF